MAEPERDHPGYEISTDPARLDVTAIHAYLNRSYWAEGISRELVARSLQGSMCFGLFHTSGQVGFARVVTDRATFAYLCDVYVLEQHRGKGLSHWLLRSLLAHPDLQGMRRFLLATRDAHGLYAKVGFAPIDDVEKLMQIRRPGLYLKPR